MEPRGYVGDHLPRFWVCLLDVTGEYSDLPSPRVEESMLQMERSVIGSILSSDLSCLLAIIRKTGVAILAPRSWQRSRLRLQPFAASCLLLYCAYGVILMGREVEGPVEMADTP